MAASESEGRIIRRIVDYLNDGEELGVEGAVGTPPRSPAAAMAARLSRIKWPRLVGLGRKGGSSAKEKAVLVVEEEEGAVVVDKREQVPVAVSTSEQAAERNCEYTSTSGSGTRHAAELGMGVSLVFLLAKTSDEFNKMVKLRAEMEALLEQFKHQARETIGGTGHDVPEPEPDNRGESTTSSCVTDRNDRSAGAHVEDQAASFGMEEPSCEWRKRMDDDGIEEEFHAELERLQVTYSSVVPLFAAEEELGSEPSDDNIDDYRHAGEHELGEVVEDEDDNDDDDDETEYNGVSAVALERRLHELLHDRNRERIEELEAALRRAEKKLAEKELEVSLWKDTAKFALRQENELQ